MPVVRDEPHEHLSEHIEERDEKEESQTQLPSTEENGKTCNDLSKEQLDATVSLFEKSA